MLKVFKVRGDSMHPIINDGDFVLTSRLKRMHIGAFVVVRHPEYKVMVKRVIDINHQGRFKLSGENDQSVSTSKMGWLAPESIVGIVLWHCKSPNS